MHVYSNVIVSIGQSIITKPSGILLKPGHASSLPPPMRASNLRCRHIDRRVVVVLPACLVGLYVRLADCIAVFRLMKVYPNPSLSLSARFPLSPREWPL